MTTYPAPMTAADAPAPYVASASTTSSASYAAWKAFNGATALDTDRWASAPPSKPEWLKIDLGTPRLIESYRVYINAGNAAARDWTIEGSDDDASWETLDTVTGQTGWVASPDRTFTIDAPTPYRYYRMSITASAGGSSSKTVHEWSLFTADAPTVEASPECSGGGSLEASATYAPACSPSASGSGGAVCGMRRTITSAHGVTLPVLVAAFRAAPVAFAAGLSRDLWASEIAPRVYDSLGGYTGGRHRGRLPFVEIEQGAETYDNRASDLGLHPREWVVRIHVGGLNETVAEQRARNMLGAALAVLRATDNAWLGNSQGGSFTKDPLGYVLAATIGTRNTYDPATHDTVRE